MDEIQRKKALNGANKTVRKGMKKLNSSDKLIVERVKLRLKGMSAKEKIKLLKPQALEELKTEVRKELGLI